jgi:tetratricopeptide (TPR) repeat protein
LLIVGRSVHSGLYDGLASTVDVFPTILGAAGLELPPNDGIDLLVKSVTGRRSIPQESMFGANAFGLAPVYGLRTEKWFWESSPADHLWDIQSDLLEQSDLAAERKGDVDSLKKVRETFEVVGYKGPEQKDRETLEMLRSLGYIGGGSAAGTEDVREFSLEGADLYFRMQTYMHEQNFEEADVEVVKFLKLYPQSPPVWIEAGFIAVALKDFPKAALRFRKVIELEPENSTAHLNLGNVLWAMGQPDMAEQQFRQVLELEPEDMYALFNLGRILLKQNRSVEAKEFLQKFLNLYPNHTKAAEVRTQLEGN